MEQTVYMIPPEVLPPRNYKLVLANGCWDLFHIGHLRTLQYARTKGDKLLVAVNTDESVTKLKGITRPIIPLEERMEILAALREVDWVIPFDDLIDLLKLVKPDVIVKGESPAVGAELVKEVYYAPFVPGRSTTQIVERIRGQ